MNVLRGILTFVAFCLLACAVFVSIAPVSGASWFWAFFAAVTILLGGVGYASPQKPKAGSA